MAAAPPARVRPPSPGFRASGTSTSATTRASSGATARSSSPAPSWVCSSGLVVALIQTPEYQAGVMLQIEPPAPTFMTVTDALVGAGGYWQNTDFYNTQFKVLRSKGLGEKVVARLKLTDQEPFKSSPDPAILFMSHVGVVPIPESRLVTVTVTHHDPKDAALWANTLADVYIEQSLETRVEAARQAYDWLQERLGATQEEMRVAQDRLFKSYQTQDLFVSEGSVSAVSTSIAALNEDYVQAQARRIEIEAALKQAREMERAGEDLDALPQVASDGAVSAFNAQLAGLEVERGRLGEKFKPGHPEMQKVTAQIDQLQRAKANRAGQILEALRAEFAQLRKREDELQGGDRRREGPGREPEPQGHRARRAAEGGRLRQEPLRGAAAEAQRDRHRRLHAQHHGDHRGPGGAPQYPVRPQKRRSALAGMLVGLLGGLGLVLARDFLANTIRDAEEIERYLHLDLLAAVPRYTDETFTLATEAYQNLRTALIFARRDEQGPGGAGDRDRAPGGQDHHDPQPRRAHGRRRERRRWWWTATCGGPRCTSAST